MVVKMHLFFYKPYSLFMCSHIFLWWAGVCVCQFLFLIFCRFVMGKVLYLIRFVLIFVTTVNVLLL